MGRWSYLDTDEERMPSGMTRMGYDADTQTYSYLDSDGSIWEGAPGNRYGKIFKVSSPPRLTARPKANSAPEPMKAQVANPKACNAKTQVPSRSNLFDEDTIAERRDYQQLDESNSSRTSSIPDISFTTFPNCTWDKEHEDADLSATNDISIAKHKTSHSETMLRHVKRRRAREAKRTLQRRSTMSKIRSFVRRTGLVAESGASSGGSSNRLYRASRVSELTDTPAPWRLFTTLYNIHTLLDNRSKE